jgi:hypothetical protein
VLECYLTHHHLLEQRDSRTLTFGTLTSPENKRYAGKDAYSVGCINRQRMRVRLGGLRMVEGQKPGIKPKVSKGALDNAIAKRAEATFCASDTKPSGKFGCPQVEVRGGLVLWAQAAPSYRPNNKEDTP